MIPNARLIVFRNCGYLLRQSTLKFVRPSPTSVGTAKKPLQFKRGQNRHVAAVNSD